MSDAEKDRSMQMQKEMLAAHYERLEGARDAGERERMGVGVGSAEACVGLREREARGRDDDA